MGTKPPPSKHDITYEPPRRPAGVGDDFRGTGRPVQPSPPSKQVNPAPPKHRGS